MIQRRYDIGVNSIKFLFRLYFLQGISIFALPGNKPISVAAMYDGGSGTRTGKLITFFEHQSISNFRENTF